MAQTCSSVHFLHYMHTTHTFTLLKSDACVSNQKNRCVSHRAQWADQPHTNYRRSTETTGKATSASFAIRSGSSWVYDIVSKVQHRVTFYRETVTSAGFTYPHHSAPFSIIVHLWNSPVHDTLMKELKVGTRPLGSLLRPCARPSCDRPPLC